MALDKEEAADSLAGHVDGSDRNTNQGERSMNVISVPTEVKDWNGLLPSGVAIEVDWPPVESLCCGDSVRRVDRAGFVVTAAL